MHYVIDAFYPNPKGSGRRLRIAKEKEACSCQSEKSPLEGKMSRDAIRQILAREFLQWVSRQNLAYCVSAPDSLFGLFGI
jgi:hypothetical protein